MRCGGLSVGLDTLALPPSLFELRIQLGSHEDDQARRDPAETETPKPESIEELFEALESPLLSYALRLTGARSPAEDVVQDIYLRVQRHLGKYDPTRPNPQ